MKLVIIAAGEGSRIQAVSKNSNKTLLSVGGRRIIDILLENCVRCGIYEVVIVTGYRNQAIEEAVNGNVYGLSIKFIFNPDWRQPNGISVLTAKPAIPVGENFLVSMSDHLYSAALLKKIIHSNLENTVANVGLDFRIDNIFDLEDGMKVKTQQSENNLKVVGMNKQLTDFDAIDCGVFKCRYEFFTTLETAKAQGNCSLADACNLLINESRLGGVDINNEFWIDVDTPEALEYCSEIIHNKL